MAEKTQRSELNYVISGALLLFGGGYLVNLGQDDGGVAAVVVGAALIALGLGLLVRGVISGRR